MILVLGNFAGVFSNVCKLLQWSLCSKEKDTLLFYYTNKFQHNDSFRVLPFRDYEADRYRICFYNVFEFPQGCSLDTFLEPHTFEMGYPQIEKENLPPCLQSYESGFVFCSPRVYKDPQFPLIRKLYHEHMERRLPFTTTMKNYLVPELFLLQKIQKEGKRILAVFLRSTCHFEGYSVDNVFDELKTTMKDYDYVLPITQIRPFFERVRNEFQDKCICLPRTYLPGDTDWTVQVLPDEEFAHEFRNVIADVYLASQCDFILGGSSNMMLGALFMNPTVPFKLFQELEHRNGL
jgi:hypothetical protein